MTTSDLTTFRDYCHSLATTGHHPDCPAYDPSLWQVEWIKYSPADQVAAFARGEHPIPDPPCLCSTPESRELFRHIADEVDSFIATQELRDACTW